MDYGVAVLRVLHIFSTVFWTGLAVTNIAFVVPAAGKAGPEGGKFMGVLLRGPLIAATNIAIVIAASSGLFLYVHDWTSFRGEWWIGTSAGLSFTAGAVFGLAAAGVFGALTQPAFRSMVKLGAEMEAGGGPPKPKQLTRAGELKSRAVTFGRINALLLAGALLFMVVGGSY